jgi:predicted  nucleic acid-binding Zn-ribbon protein
MVSILEPLRKTSFRGRYALAVWSVFVLFAGFIFFAGSWIGAAGSHGRNTLEPVRQRLVDATTRISKLERSHGMASDEILAERQEAAELRGKLETAASALGALDQAKQDYAEAAARVAKLQDAIRTTRKQLQEMQQDSDAILQKLSGNLAGLGELSQAQGKLEAKRTEASDLENSFSAWKNALRDAASERNDLMDKSAQAANSWKMDEKCDALLEEWKAKLYAEARSIGRVYGAFAVSRSGECGYSIDDSDLEMARTRVMRHCEQRSLDCNIRYVYR